MSDIANVLRRPACAPGAVPQTASRLGQTALRGHAQTAGRAGRRGSAGVRTGGKSPSRIDVNLLKQFSFLIQTDHEPLCSLRAKRRSDGAPEGNALAYDGPITPLPHLACQPQAQVAHRLPSGFSANSQELTSRVAVLTMIIGNHPAMWTSVRSRARRCGRVDVQFVVIRGHSWSFVRSPRRPKPQQCENRDMRATGNVTW